MEHAALRSFDGSIASNIFPGLLEWVFTCDAFQRWAHDNGKWQLHCIGGPGSGKTTLANLVSHHLAQHPEYHGEPVVSICIDEDVSDSQVNIIEAILVMTYRGLSQRAVPSNDDRGHAFSQYMDCWNGERPEGARRKERLRLLRQAVYAQLEASKDVRVFLVIDGIDRCGPSLRYMLETELTALQEQFVKIMLTARSAIFEQSEVFCDHEDHDVIDDNPLSMYMECRNKSCEEFVVCLACKDAQRICHRCNVHGSLHESYDHVNIRLWVPRPTMEMFVAWDLEREHGDLGLHSSARKPPLSKLGKGLISTKDTRPIRSVLEYVVDNSYDNIAIARARLDLIHEMESVEDLDARAEQLPATIVALFDSGLRAILAQPENQREMAMVAFNLAARYDEGEAIRVLLDRLRDLRISGIQSGEEIVEATRGWLVDTMTDGPQCLKIYNKNFLFYVDQKYHRAIHRSSIQIEAGSRRNSAFTTSTISTARFEPQNIFEEPQDINPFKLSRTVTAMPAIEEAPAQPFLVRKGTVAWS